MNSKLRPEIAAALISELLGDADRILQRSAEVGERLDTIAKRVDFEEGRILEAAKILGDASAALEKSANSAVERNRVALAVVLAETMTTLKTQMQDSLASGLDNFAPQILDAIEKRENKATKEISGITARLRKIEGNSAPTTNYISISLLILNLAVLLAVLWRVFK